MLIPGMTDERFKKYLEDEGYLNVCKKNDRWCALFRFTHSIGIVADIHEFGYESRWCYYEQCVAEGELKDWNGIGEPQNWHRALPSMRRRDENNKDIGVW